MGHRGSQTNVRRLCQTNPEHLPPKAVLQEIAELRSEFGP